MGLEAGRHHTNLTYVLARVLEGNWGEPEPLHQEEEAWLAENRREGFVAEGATAVSAVEVTVLGNIVPPASIAQKLGGPK